MNNIFSTNKLISVERVVFLTLSTMLKKHFNNKNNKRESKKRHVKKETCVTHPNDLIIRKKNNIYTENPNKTDYFAIFIE